MKKYLATMMVVILLAAGNAGWMNMTYANEGSAADEDYEYNDDAIDELFNQRERLMLEMWDAEEDGVVALNEDMDYNEAFHQIDDELQMLGVRKINPLDEDDMAYLRELPATVGQTEVMQSDGIYDDAPDLSIIANSFDLYISDGTITPNDGTEAGKKTYSYRAVTVTDKVEGSTRQLYQRRKVRMLTATEIIKEQVTALLEYNFQILVDKFYGVFIGNPFLQWTLGNLDAIFSNTSSMYADAGKDEGYTTAYSTTTTMKYYYLYHPVYGWKLIASCATANVNRTDRFVGEINAKPFDKDINNEEYTIKSGSGRTLRQYITAYVSVMDTRPDYFASAWFGQLKFKTYSKKEMKYEPKYADTPFDLTALPNGSTY